MKKILITGENSYIGNSFQNWVSQYKEKYEVDTISVRNDKWKSKSFSGYDVVLHVAGIAHIKETEENKNLYYKVNRDLAIEIAEKSKKDGVSQFVFLSSMSVYGMEEGVITKNTIPNPKSNYGISKLQAEEFISKIEDNKFKVSILRPPMVYGENCKGNYTRLKLFAIKSPIFPLIENKRSMIYINNLCEFIRLLIENKCNGIFLPQNKEYVCTSEMVKIISNKNGKKIIMTKLFNPIINRLNIRLINKIFGDLVYDKDMSNTLELDYQIYEFNESI